MKGAFIHPRYGLNIRNLIFAVDFFLSICNTALTCIRSEKENICTSIKLTLDFGYVETITENDVVFELLTYAEEIASMISNAIMKAKYVGRVPIESSTVFTFSGIDLDDMDGNDIEFFENNLKSFLENMFSLSSITIKNAKVEKQALHRNEQRYLHLPFKTIEDQKTRHTRLLQNKLTPEPTLSTLYVSTTIRGQFTPPPMLDLGVLIDEIYSESGHYFIESLARHENFQRLNEVQTKSETLHRMRKPAWTPSSVNHSQQSIFFIKEFYIPLYIICALLILFAIISLIQKIAKKKGEVKVIGMDELMERRESKIAHKDLKRGNSHTTATTCTGSLSRCDSRNSRNISASSLLKSDQRLYSAKNIVRNEGMFNSRRLSYRE